MEEFIKLLIAAAVLVLGIPLGNLLRKWTKEEIKEGRKYISLLSFIGLIGGFVGLIIGNDTLMFSLFFIAIVSSRSLVVRK